MATPPKSKSWPTQVDYDHVEKAITKACTALDEFNVNKLRAVDYYGELRDGYPQPTVADIGRLSMLIERVDLDLRSMRGDLARLESQRNSISLTDLAYA